VNHWLGVSPKVEYDNIIEEYLRLWIKGTIEMVFFAFLEEESKKIDIEKIQADLMMVMNLKHTPKETIPFAVQELVQAAELEGFETLEDSSFIWDAEAGRYYDTFGHITTGEKVIVKKRPLIFKGKVVRKGMVIRKGR